MYIFKNAWTSIKRNKGRNILMGIIINFQFILIPLVLVLIIFCSIFFSLGTEGYYLCYIAIGLLGEVIGYVPITRVVFSNKKIIFIFIL